MSNHAGSYMLNEAITILNRHRVFAGIDKTARRTLMREIVAMADRYDCNQGEVLAEVAAEFYLCSYCLADTDNPADELCPTCRAEWERTD